MASTKPKSYYNEISLMMYGLGDSHEPNPATVTLVEKIVQQQMQQIVAEAQSYWDGKVLQGEHIVFLLRHSKKKMQRLVKHLQSKDLTKKLSRVNPEIVEIDPEEIPRNPLLDFIDYLDETGEFMDVDESDEVKIARMVRADKIAQQLDEKKYLEFQKARCASFKAVGGGLDKINEWIDPNREINFALSATEMLSYLAYQTVAELIDCALLVREDVRSGSDPLSHLSRSRYTAAMFNGPHRFGEKKPDYTRIRSGQPPISVDEINEVMRRVYNAQAGRLNFGGKVPATHFILAV